MAPSTGFGNSEASSLRGPAFPSAIENNKALLLIRDMVAAVHADDDVLWEEILLLVLPLIKRPTSNHLIHLKA